MRQVSRSLSRIIGTSALVGVVFLVLSCGKPGGPAVDEGLLQGTPDFSMISRAILVPRCLSCHADSAPSGGVSFSSYAGTLATVVPYAPEKSSLFLAASSGRMPKGGPALSSTELSAISAWISAGAKEFLPPTPVPVPTPTPTPTPVSGATYTWIRTNVLQGSCLSCHGSAGGSGGVDLSTYSAVKANASRMLSAVSTGVMPPGGSLNSTQINAISAWLSAGTPNN